MTTEPIDLDVVQELYDAALVVGEYVPSLVAELREARATIGRVWEVVESDTHGTYWGEVQVPQRQLRAALTGGAQ